jgi:hypothetical protein
MTTTTKGGVRWAAMRRVVLVLGISMALLVLAGHDGAMRRDAALKRFVVVVVVVVIIVITSIVILGGSVAAKWVVSGGRASSIGAAAGAWLARGVERNPTLVVLVLVLVVLGERTVLQELLKSRIRHAELGLHVRPEKPVTVEPPPEGPAAPGGDGERATTDGETTNRRTGGGAR